MNNYTKDSANLYTLYVDQGSSYSVTIPVSSFYTAPSAGLFNILSSATDSLLVDAIDNLAHRLDFDCVGHIRQHPTSKKSVEFAISYSHENKSITISLAPDVSAELVHLKYNFDVVYRDGDSTDKAFGGYVIVNNNYSSF